jgi:hypothetical protein
MAPFIDAVKGKLRQATYASSFYIETNAYRTSSFTKEKLLTQYGTNVDIV